MEEYVVIFRKSDIAKTGKPYATLRLANLDEVLGLMVWDLPEERTPQLGQLVKVRNVRERNGSKSVDAADFLVGGFPDADHPLGQLVLRPVARTEWDACFEKLLSYCHDDALKAIIDAKSKELYRPYSDLPAAVGVHHAYPGGLLNHTYQMLNMFSGLYPTLPYTIKPERVILALLYHDWGKQFEYTADGQTRPEMYLLGHIFMSAKAMWNVLAEAKIHKDEIQRIVHCILAHHQQKEWGSPVVPCTQEAAVVTYLDGISARVDTINFAGNMEYSRALGTNVIKG